MNKRKPDDEFAKIDLSYFTADGKEVVVYCPESRDATATQQPHRKVLTAKLAAAPPATVHSELPAEVASHASPPAQTTALEDMLAGLKAGRGGSVEAPPLPTLEEQHFTIFYGEMGHSYESLIVPYLTGAQKVVVEDPYIRATHQVQNFVRFCEAVVKGSAVKRIHLVTCDDAYGPFAEVRDKLADLAQSLLERDVVLEVELNPKMHDREIRIDNGWVIKIGRGLDFYQRPESWFEIGASDLSLRKCLETKVDIFRSN